MNTEARHYSRCRGALAKKDRQGHYSHEYYINPHTHHKDVNGHTQPCVLLPPPLFYLLFSWDKALRYLEHGLTLLVWMPLPHVDLRGSQLVGLWHSLTCTTSSPCRSDWVYGLHSQPPPIFVPELSFMCTQGGELRCLQIQNVQPSSRKRKKRLNRSCMDKSQTHNML